jgi:DNA-binding beta-propeller fold protein YncE
VTVGYDLSVAAYDSVSFSVSAQEAGPSSVFFKDDGTKMYVIGFSGDEINEYDLSTAWDITTASASSVLSISSYETLPRGLVFKTDGTSLYFTGLGNDQVRQYDMTTAWDISTASYSKTFSVSSQDTSPSGLFFKSDGTKMYVSGAAGDDVNEYDLSTAWDVSTASYSNNFSLSSESIASPQSLFFTSDGTKMFVVSRDDDNIYYYSLSTPWDITSASYSNTSFSVTSQESSPYGIFFKSDGTKMYVVGSSNDTIYQYSTGSTVTTATLDLSTGSVFEITPTSDIQVGLSNPAASGTVSQATLLLDGAAGTTYDFSVLATTNKTLSVSSQDVTEEGLFINPDGTELYMLGDANDSVFQYTMTTAWDLSTASYTQSFSGASQDGGMQGVSFKTDGTKMYMLGRSNDNLYQYSLSTAWDISTASYDSVSLNVTSQDTNPYNLHFKPDGTKLYIVGNTNNRIYQYSLSTAWDLSTASYDSVSYTTTSQDGTPKDIYIKSDGTKLYLLGSDNHKIFVYTMSTAWDLSTISYDSVSYPSSGNLETYDNSSTAFYISDDGVYFYLVGNSTGDIEQFYIAGAATITYDSTLQFGGGTAPDSPAIGETDVLTFSTRDGGTTYQAAIAIDGAA